MFFLWSNSLKMTENFNFQRYLRRSQNNFNGSLCLTYKYEKYYVANDVTNINWAWWRIWCLELLYTLPFHGVVSFCQFALHLTFRPRIFFFNSSSTVLFSSILYVCRRQRKGRRLKKPSHSLKSWLVQHKHSRGHLPPLDGPSLFS